MEKTKGQLLMEKLGTNRKNTWLSYSTDIKKIFEFNEAYKEFMGKSKTERLAIKNIIVTLEKNGFKDIENIKSASTGDKIYKNIKDKSVIAFIIGEKTDEFRIIGSHVDSPRLDLKPSPLYEDSNAALLKTHYYGGIKKYQWVNQPLALHGVAFTKEGKKVEIHIGENSDEPKFIITDLLPHLAQNQMERTAKKTIEAEELNIIVGNMPLDDEAVISKIKLNILKILNEQYGIIEEDLNVAELEFVPAGKPMDIGFDKSLTAMYGQDDKVCAYTSLIALVETKKPKHTAVAFFSDKEEIGSIGDTGAYSFVLKNFARDYSKIAKADEPSRILERSKAISADVTSAQDPTFKDVSDSSNTSYLGLGISIEKYGGSAGKSGTHDAHAEYMQYVRSICDKNKIPWQTGELGKIDIGGGGTIGMFMSRYGMDCVDAGPCVLSMHSPYEVTSKADVYTAYRFYKAFFND